jgi:hypothetical protein
LETSVKRLSVKLFYEFCKNDELHYKIKVQKIKIRLLKNSCQGMKTKIDRERAKFGLLHTTYIQFSLMHKDCHVATEMEKLSVSAAKTAEKNQKSTLKDRKNKDPKGPSLSEGVKARITEQIIQQIKSINVLSKDSHEIKAAIDPKRVCKIIGQIYELRMTHQTHLTPENYASHKIARFAFDTFMEKFGNLTGAEKKYREFLIAVSQFAQNCPRISLFGELMGFSPEAHGHQDENFVFNAWKYLRTSKIGVTMPEHFSEEKILVPWTRLLDFLKNCVAARMLKSDYKNMFVELCGKKVENAVNKDGTNRKIFLE